MHIVFLAAIAALYAIMSVGRLVGRSVGRSLATSFKKCSTVIGCSEKVKGVHCSDSLAHKKCSLYFLAVTAALYFVMCVV